MAGRFGYLFVPRYAASRKRGEPYAAALRERLRQLGEAGACEFVLDLRGNGGGSVWLMLDGLGTPIGCDVLLSFDAPVSGSSPSIGAMGVPCRKAARLLPLQRASLIPASPTNPSRC